MFVVVTAAIFIQYSDYCIFKPSLVYLKNQEGLSFFFFHFVFLFFYLRCFDREGHLSNNNFQLNYFTGPCISAELPWPATS